MRGNIGILSVVAVMVLGIYVLPSVTARFAGSHTMEFNNTYTTANATGMNCGVCHSYIVSQLNATDTANLVVTQHITALMKENYTRGSLNLSDTAFEGIDTSNVCMLCHLAEQSITGTHTKIIIRACTDVDCHGADSSTQRWNGTEAVTGIEYGGQNVTAKIADTSDAHSGFYLEMNKTDSYYVKEEAGTGNYTQDFYTCLACHTHVGFTLNITSMPQAYGISINYTTSGANVAMNISDVWMNTSMTTNLSIKAAGTSPWS